MIGLIECLSLNKYLYINSIVINLIIVVQYLSRKQKRDEKLFIDPFGNCY